VAVVAHEPIEFGLAQHKQPAIGQGSHVGHSRLAGEQGGFSPPERKALCDSRPAASVIPPMG
jgi:hypothetical protein